jgi:hypothetical protein
MATVHASWGRLVAGGLALMCAAGVAMGRPVAMGRSDSLAGTVKVKLPAGVGTPAYVRAAGGTLVSDYGSFSIAQFRAGTVPTVEGAEILDQEDLILLNAGALDTTKPAVQQLRQARGEFAGRVLHMVQFAGPIQPAWYAKLEQTGVEIVTYIPSNAYLVYGTAAQLSALQTMAAGSPEVQWEGAYADAYKLDPATTQLINGAVGSAELMNSARMAGATDALYAVQLVQDPGANKLTEALIDAIRSGPVRQLYNMGNYRNVVAPIPANLVAMIAAQPEVISIQPYVIPQLRDERQAQIVSGNLSGNSPSGPGYLAWLASRGFTQAQFTASNFVVDVTDSGIDNATTSPNHLGLYLNGVRPGTSRIVYNRLVGTPNAGSTLQGCDGHGNLNTHIVLGYNNSATGAPFTDASGFRYGLGICPFVKGGSSVVFDPSTFTFPNYTSLQSQAYNNGARISTNSWGANVAGAYNTDSQSYDFLVRDAQPTGSTFPAAGNQQMVILFSAGNAGSGAGTIGSPATGKNVITVGASENVQAFGAADGCGTTDAEASSANDMVAFSSRGPCADSRKKPDIVAPGTHVSGGVAQTAAPAATGTANACFSAAGVCGGAGGANFFPAGQQFYSASSGTSHSCPAVAGGAALIRQFFLNQALSAPTPAMTKALLMNSARYMNGVGANDTLWSSSQGMGCMNLGEAFNRGAVTPTVFRDGVAADLFTATGQTRVFTGSINDSTKPFRVTLAWTDAPGTTSSAAFKNNLDLTVVIGANTYRGNVFTGANSSTGGVADTRNNVESVFLPAGTTGSYTVTITATSINSDGVPNSGGALDQDFALVIYNAGTGCTAAAVTTNPTAQTVCAGTSTTLTAAGTGTGPLSFQWRKGGSNVSGATSSSFTITSPVVGDSGSYDCVISNSCGSATTTAAALVVQGGPATITTNPVSQSACTGTGVTFTIAATSAAPATYQWRKGGSNISGATGTSFTIASVVGGNAGSYDCAVSNVCGLALSASANLTVNVPPTIVTSPTTQTVCAGGSVSLSASAVGSPSPTLQWRRNTINIPGATGGTLTLNPVSAADAGTYDCVATNTCNSVSTTSATLTVNSAPSITGNPSAQTVCVGSPASFSAAATGTPAPTFQWRKATVNIPGATSAAFSIASVVADDAALYDCVITNSCGSVTTTAAPLNVNTAPSITLNPTSQTLCQDAGLTLTTSASGTPAPGFQWRRNSTNILGATSSTFSIASIQPLDAGSYDCVITNSCGTVTTSPAIVSVNTAPLITTQPVDVTTCDGGTAVFTAAGTGSPLPGFQWRKGGLNIPGATSATLTLNPVAPASAGSYDCVLTNSCGSMTTSSVTLNVQSSPEVTSNPSPQLVCENGAASFSVMGSGSPAPTYQWRRNAINIPGATASTLSIPSALVGDAGSYDCVLTNACGSATSGSASLMVNTAPFVTSDPTGATVNEGDPASFSVTATGTGPLSYQWRKNTLDIGGATSSTFSILATVAGDAGTYDCVITNSCGSRTSAGALLTIGVGCPCVADFDGSGGTPDAGDVDSFFVAWLSGDPSADADCSGGTPDAGDVDIFFIQWLSGGC